MTSHNLLVLILVAGIKWDVICSEASEDVQLLKEQLLGVQQQMQQQMATERQNMQHQIDNMQHEMATERHAMANERQQMQLQITMLTERQERMQIKHHMTKDSRQEMQHTVLTAQLVSLQKRFEETQKEAATDKQAMQQKMADLESENQNFKQSIHDINNELTNVVHESHKLSAFVHDVFNVTNKLDEGNDLRLSAHDTLGKDFGSKHNGSFIGFSAYATEHRDYSDGSIVLFDGIITNQGPFYTPETSVFLCAFEGYYLFTLTVFANTGNVMAAEIILDATQVASVYAAAGEADTGSVTVVVFCPLYKQVFVRGLFDGNRMHGGSIRYSVFSGFFLASM